MNESYAASGAARRPALAAVIGEHGHPTRLVAAAWKGASIVHTALAARRPDYEGARAEAQAMYPGRMIIVPRLKEPIP